MENTYEFMAKAATDSYFANLNNDVKEFMLSDKQAYLHDYMKTFKLALQEAKKMDQIRFQEFGEENSKLFK